VRGRRSLQLNSVNIPAFEVAIAAAAIAWSLLIISAYATAIATPKARLSTLIPRTKAFAGYYVCRSKLMYAEFWSREEGENKLAIN
jgi:hypothetical protein